MASEVFLQSQLFPLVDGQTQLDENTLVDLLVDFKRRRADLNVEFEISQVMARLLNRFQYHLIDDAEGTGPELPDALEQQLDLFARLADLDFERIDEAVRDRLRSG